VPIEVEDLALGGHTREREQANVAVLCRSLELSVEIVEIEYGDGIEMDEEG
jgi:hypothetical protein